VKKEIIRNGPKTMASVTTGLKSAQEKGKVRVPLDGASKKEGSGHPTRKNCGGGDLQSTGGKVRKDVWQRCKSETSRKAAQSGGGRIGESGVENGGGGEVDFGRRTDPIAVQFKRVVKGGLVQVGGGLEWVVKRRPNKKGGGGTAERQLVQRKKKKNFLGSHLRKGLRNPAPRNKRLSCLGKKTWGGKTTGYLQRTRSKNAIWPEKKRKNGGKKATG